MKIMELGGYSPEFEGIKNHREHRVHRENLHRSALSVYSVVEKLYSNSLFQEKLKHLRIEWRERL